MHRAARALGPLRDRAIFVASGSSARRAAEQAEDIVASGVAALVSFGIAGALDPALQVGDVVRASRVASETSTFGEANGPLVWGSEAIIGDPAEKAALHRRTGAAIVDLESHGVAAAADRAGLPFFVIRAVSDDARHRLPAYLADAVTPDGRPRLGPVLAGLARSPTTLPALIRLGRNTSKALEALERAGETDLPALLRRFDPD
ncbi:MAG: phosphorylase [Pseudomonadota bacterium]